MYVCVEVWGCIETDRNPICFLILRISDIIKITYFLSIGQCCTPCVSLHVIDYGA